ncbi:MAG: hypothetical protein AB1568_15610 [Thermodesulfobacteriota bacterium]
MSSLKTRIERLEGRAGFDIPAALEPHADFIMKHLAGFKRDNAQGSRLLSGLPRELLKAIVGRLRHLNDAQQEAG